MKIMENIDIVRQRRYQEKIDKGEIKVIQTKHYDVRVNVLDESIQITSHGNTQLCHISFLQVLGKMYLTGSLKR